ncbi:MAG TPA: DNA polymerase III subunit gamma/tau [Steroidobacteraceae bacterium]|nr:DNA polymerase III subunit gamma/tau [Steroidobacteraceae bacterium]
MSYLVLARKWRPRSFGELVGQQHVLRALVNALNSNRVHHAFLFTGTRGVGKTTISRILAKSLNCERGVSAEPCGQCGACQEIDAGRFVDLLEVDAASRTKVDDTREMLDNVQYSPARGRYKIYLIDEVHMLSTHSFNALLKTLEEPPPHVKFLLATTDPQKLPVTVLSRCLQFNLKRLTPALILKRLVEIADAEKIEHEPEALRLVAKAAQGSMRDGLSLLDQAIAFAGNRLSAADMRSMLGTIEQTHVIDLIDALAARDGKRLLAHVAELDERSPDYHGVLADIAATLQRVALMQAVADMPAEEGEDTEALNRFVQLFTPEEVQLNYQIALTGRRDLDLAPDSRNGFEMTMLRMLAFQPARDGAAETPAGSTRPRVAAAPASSSAPSANTRLTQPAPAQSIATQPTSTQPAAKIAMPNPGAVGEDWACIVSQLNLQGGASTLASHCSLLGREGARVRLLLDRAGEQFRRPVIEDKLVQALCAYFGEAVKIDIQLEEEAKVDLDTPARRQQVHAQDQLRAARASIDTDPNVQAMRDIFGATVQPDSVKPN